MVMNSWQWVHFHHNADASNWYGDSFAWMRVASREDSESGRAQRPSRIDHHRLNVALVSAGVAIELIYKVLLIADRAEIKATHDIGTLHGLLEGRKAQVENIVLGEEWSNVKAFLDFMDDDLKHADRKYWMSNPPKGQRGGTGFGIATGPMTVPSLARIHKQMAELVNLPKLVAQYNLESARVITTQALTKQPIIGHKAMATRHFERDGRKVEYTVYESTGSGWHVPDYVRGWWEMPQESGDPTGRFVFLLNRGEYDQAVDYWIGLP